MIHELKHPYPSVLYDGGPSYGGSQLRCSRWDLRKCGCGVIALLDLIVYLTRHHGCRGPEAADRDPIPAADYDRLADQLQRRYLPMLPPVGINGLTLAAGADLWFRFHHVPLHARWGVQGKRFWSAMEELLDRDLPVIFSIGPNFPFVWQQHKLPLYRKSASGVYTAVSRVKAHYITATGLDENWIRISSWGREYYIHRGEYEAYGKAHSISLIHNLLWLGERNL